mmetsp:Transcript_12066/g.30434  ORF Transcript_12066/g.30434 Transcript_12066/m.30434 type:complete len:81 (+) Transcript_12066:472-714(+)
MKPTSISTIYSFMRGGTRKKPWNSEIRGMLEDYIASKDIVHKAPGGGREKDGEVQDEDAESIEKSVDSNSSEEEGEGAEE